MRSKRGKNGFAVCVKNRHHPASLELRKIYRVLSDDKAAAEGMVRVIDESARTTFIQKIISFPYPSLNQYSARYCWRSDSDAKTSA